MENLHHEVVIKKTDRGGTKMEIKSKNTNSENVINKVIDYSEIDMNVKLVIWLLLMRIIGCHGRDRFLVRPKTPEEAAIQSKEFV